MADEKHVIGLQQYRQLREAEAAGKDVREVEFGAPGLGVAGDLLLANPTIRNFKLTSEHRHLAMEIMRNQLPELQDFMPDRIALATLRKMRRDPMIQMGLHFIKMPLLTAKWTVTGPDETQAEFIAWALGRVWHRLLESILLSLDFGYVGIVKQWTYSRPPEGLGLWSGAVDPLVPDDAFALPPEFVKPRFTRGGKFNGIEYRPNFGELQEIPDEYTFWYTYDRAPSFGSYYGFPRIGFCYAYWRSYWYRWLLYDRHFEQDADPPLIVWGPSGTYKDPEDPARQYYYRDDGLAIGDSLRNGGTVYLPSEPYVDLQTGRPSQAKQWDASFLFGGENIAQFQQSFEYLDVMKLRSILVPEQALVEGKNGTSSRNVAATYSKIFAESQAVLMQQIDEQVNSYFVDKIAEYNFGVPAGTYKKETEDLYKSNEELMHNIMTAVAARDPLDARLDLVGMAERLNLPLLTEEEVEEHYQKQTDRLLQNAEVQAQVAAKFDTGENDGDNAQNRVKEITRDRQQGRRNQGDEE